MMPVTALLRQVGRTLRVAMLAASFSLTATACSAATDSADFKYLINANAGKTTLSLYSESESCAIRTSPASQGQQLDIPWPCGFVRIDERMQALTEIYDGVGTVFVIAGPLATKDAHNKSESVSTEHACSNSGQAIAVNNDGVKLLESHQWPVGFCHRLGFDEKDFYSFAHPVE